MLPFPKDRGVSFKRKTLVLSPLLLLQRPFDVGNNNAMGLGRQLFPSNEKDAEGKDIQVDPLSEEALTGSQVLRLYQYAAFIFYLSA